MMVQSHSDLDQPLKKFLFLIRGRAPNVLQHLVCVKKLSAIEHLYPAPEPVHIHAASISDHEQRRNFNELTVIAGDVFIGQLQPYCKMAISPGVSCGSFFLEPKTSRFENCAIASFSYSLS